jgi:succinoglycan biosynthesis protein ExoM
VVQAAQASMPFPMSYLIEPQPGIVAARNAAVAAAEPFEFLAFIDDDEVPSEQWLDQLVAVQRRTSADVVTGTVLPEFEHAPPRWMVGGGFFERPRHLDGELIGYARTSNVLIRHDVLQRHTPPFDPAYGLSGGEDTHFFMRAALEGARIAWADRAVVTETFPSERVSWRWLMAREYRRGNTLSLCLLDLTNSRRRRARRAAHGMLRIAKGFIATAASIGGGRASLLRAGREIALGSGMLTGLVGARFAPYRHGHRQ